MSGEALNRCRQLLIDMTDVDHPEQIPGLCREYDDLYQQLTDAERTVLEFDGPEHDEAFVGCSAIGCDRGSGRHVPGCSWAEK